MPVPEAAAHVDYRPSLGNHNIGSALKALVANSIAPSARKQTLPDHYLGQGIPAANLCHQAAALFFADSVHRNEEV